MPNVRETSIASWKLAIEDGLDYRRLYGRESEWARNEALFYQADPMQDSNVGPNIIYSTGDSLLSTLLVPNPFFVLKALRMNVVDAVPVLEAQLNTLLSALDLKTEAMTAATHTYIYGKGILKLGYDSEFGYCPDLDLGAATNQPLGITLSQFDKKGSRIEYDQTIQPGMPWVKAVMPHDFVVPDGSVQLKNTPWCAHRIIRHIDDIKADKKYKNKDDLQPTLSMSDWTKSYTTVMKPYRMGKTQWSASNSPSDKAEYVEMWEIHDTRTGRLMVLSMDHDKWLRNDIDYLQHDGLPFVDLTFVPKSRTFWVTPDTVYLQAPQTEAIDIAQIQKHQRRTSLLKFMFEEGAIDNDELVKYMSGKIGVGIKVKAGYDITKAIVATTPSNSNNQLQAEAEAIRRDSRETVGYGRNQSGEMSQGRHTAAEALIVNNKAEMRLDRRQDAVADMYCGLGKKLSKIIFNFWKTPRLIEIIGPDGAAQWTSFTGTQLKGEYQFRVGFSSEPVESLQSRKTQAMTLYQTLSMDPTIDPIELRRYLSRAFNDPEFSRLFKPGVVSNANLSTAMPQLQQQVGVPEQNANGGGGGASSVPKMLPQQ